MPKRKSKPATKEKWYHRVFDIPEQISSRVPFLELNNDRELFIGGYERLLCYEDGCVVLLLYDGRELHISGRDFSLRMVREGTLGVTGMVTQITFVSQQGNECNDFREKESQDTFKNVPKSFAKEHGTGEMKENQVDRAVHTGMSNESKTREITARGGTNQ